jgi:CRISPR-associated protein (TIGR02584 family)
VSGSADVRSICDAEDAGASQIAGGEGPLRLVCDAEGAGPAVSGSPVQAVRVLALPGGNPAPLVTLAWALRRDGIRVREVHAVLYASAQRWLRAELLGGVEPLAQLRALANDDSLATIVEHPALRDGAVIEDDAAPEDAVAYMDTAWRAARALQADPEPVIFALVGGRRRTLTADLVVAFQLLARPQDRLVELRLSPREAGDATAGFYFPEQRTPARVQRYDQPEPVGASDVEVRVVDVRVPRLRRLLPDVALASYAEALAAGEDAVATVDAARPRFDLTRRELRVGATTLRLPHNQALWFAALAVARRCRADGWLVTLGNPRDEALLFEVHAAALFAWHREADELSDGWAFGTEAPASVAGWRGPIRSRMKKLLAEGLAGHPWRELLVPQLSRCGTGRSVVTRERLRAPEMWLCGVLEGVVGRLEG